MSSPVLTAAPVHACVELLVEARARTLLLVAPLNEAEPRMHHDLVGAYPHTVSRDGCYGTIGRVLPGGPWVARPGAVRNTFRNRDHPIRRQIFSGYRRARDD